MSDTVITNTRLPFARPLSTYRREPGVQSLLESWERLPPRSVLSQITSGGTEIPLEALVSASRAFIVAGRRDDAWRIVEAISRRIAARTHRHLAVWGLAGTGHQEDVTRDILHMTIDCVLSNQTQNEFWECRFWTCFDRRVRTLLRDFSNRHQAHVEWDETTERTAASAIPLSTAAGQQNWTDDIEARTLLERLPEPLRTAFYLKHYAGYKEEGNGEPTIATALSVSGRTVRNYLRKAEGLLADWRAEDEGKAGHP